MFGKFTSSFLISFFSLQMLSAAPQYTTQSLEMKDYEDMRKLTLAETKKCYKADTSGDGAKTAGELEDAGEMDSSGVKQGEELRSCLKDVVALVLARREQNDAVQRELLKKTLFEIQENYRVETLKIVAKEAIEKYKANDKDQAAQATAYEQIKNVLTEAKSRIKNNKEEIEPIVKMIRDAGLSVDSKLKSFRANGPAGITPNLSDKAGEILNSKK